MIAQALLAEAAAHGIALYRVGDRIRWRAVAPPTADLVDRLRQHKADLLPLVPEGDPAEPPDPTPTPAPCPTCTGVAFWRRAGTTPVYCATCSPCPDRAGSYWYAAALPDDPLAELSDPAVQAALDWLARQRPEIVAQLVAIQHRCDVLAAGQDDQAFRDACRELVEAVRSLALESRVKRTWPN